MNILHELSQAVRTRRQEMGLSQQALARLAGLSRATIVALEGGTIKDLSITRTAMVLEVLGLGLTVAPAHPRLEPRPTALTPPLELAARTASTSYRGRLTAAELRDVLGTGELPAGLEAYVHALLDEAPMDLLARAVEQMHAEAGLARETVWANMRRLARQLKSRRNLWAC
ncbi:helix-turn-helix domain-containing protein [Ideonella sp. B508-1]|uniref:helix-turn-helix domain-containing protein n=1 Tax=Ideonella sp. B508-1 TaxID=137716 RepID=UPI0003B44A9E|nr:helix-turn-helix domain-containing protein [Ideonella sp. B508-1]